VLRRTGAQPETITRPKTGTGSFHELVEVTECLRVGRTESAVMPLAVTLAVWTMPGDAAGQLGVRHAEHHDRSDRPLLLGVRSAGKGSSRLARLPTRH
jgi:hypothetical protein